MRSGIIEQRHGRACTGTKRCGCSWRFRVDGPEDLGGGRRQVTKGGYRTRTEAQEALADVQRRLGNGDVVGVSPTVLSYLDSWIVQKRSAGLKPATLSQYEDLKKRFLEPAFGHVKLANLRAAHLEAMLAKMEADGRGLVTRRRTIATLSSALGSAMRRRLVSYNVCTQIELPPERPERRPVWDAAEVSRFLVHVQSDRLAALWRIYALVGVRRGEALALTWRKVDLEAGTLTIDRTLGEVGGHLSWGAPKTLNGTRTVAIEQGTVAALHSHRSAQDAERQALGVGYEDQDLVFAREDGAPLWPSTITSRFKDLGVAAKLPPIRLHDVRHSAASLALAAGVDLKTVSTNLGHSGISITADLYSHVVPATARAAAERVAALVTENTP